MNEDVFAGQWKQMRGELKSWWGKLADDDLDRIGGQKDKLIGLVQEKYGYTRDYAEQEVERRLKEFGNKTGGAVADITAKAQELGSTAVNKANEAATVVGEKLGSLANVIREKAPQEGAVAPAVKTVVDGLESAKHILHYRCRCSRLIYPRIFWLTIIASIRQSIKRFAMREQEQWTFILRQTKLQLLKTRAAIMSQTRSMIFLS